MDALSELLGVTEPGLWLLAATAAALAGAAVLRGVADRRRPDEETGRAWRSVGTWWALFTVLLLVLALDRVGVLILMAIVSVLLLRETLRLVGSPRALPVLTAVALVFYLWAWLDWPSVFTRAAPLLIVLVVAWEAALRAGLRDVFVRASDWHYPLLIALIGPSYVFGAASLPPPAQIPESEMGWFLLLVMLTELNDMAQSWWGRALGSRPLAPVLSPNKTWEGLLGGLATTSAVALVLCPVLTGYGRAQPSGIEPVLPSWAWSLGIGLTIGLTGLAGDLSASALKRRAGVKDSGTLLPGHGGVLDRFDSLAATAPVFFLITYLLWFPAR